MNGFDRYIHRIEKHRNFFNTMRVSDLAPFIDDINETDACMSFVMKPTHSYELEEAIIIAQKIGFTVYGKTFQVDEDGTCYFFLYHDPTLFSYIIVIGSKEVFQPVFDRMFYVENRL